MRATFPLRTFLHLALSAVALTAGCGGQTGGNTASTSPGTGGAASSAGGSATASSGAAGAAGTTIATAGKAGSTAAAGSAGMNAAGSAGAGGGGSAGTSGGSAGQAGATGIAGKGGASGSSGAGGFPACCGPAAPCPGGYECVDTICVIPPAPGTCFSDTDCALLNSGPWTCDGGKVCPCNADCSYDTILGTCVMGSGGASGAAGASGSGGATGACPTTFPSGGEPCAPNGLTCPGGACCGPVAVCVNGTWGMVISTCPLPKPCPASPPADGSSCCGGFPAACAWDECTSTGYVAATCNLGTGIWSVKTEACDTGVVCNGTTCKPGDICVEAQGGAGVSYSCMADPCGAQPLSCDCAAAICGAPPMGCLVNDPQHLTCTCDLCP